MPTLPWPFLPRKTENEYRLIILSLVNRDPLKFPDARFGRTITGGIIKFLFLFQFPHFPYFPHLPHVPVPVLSVLSIAPVFPVFPRVDSDISRHGRYVGRGRRRSEEGAQFICGEGTGAPEEIRSAACDAADASV